MLQQFDGNFLGPKILGNATGLSGFWVIFAITFFGGVFGILGMVAGVPIFSVIYAAIRSFVNTRLEKKQMSKDTSEYAQLQYIDEEGRHHLVENEKDAEKNKAKNSISSKKKGNMPTSADDVKTSNSEESKEKDTNQS